MVCRTRAFYTALCSKSNKIPYNQLASLFHFFIIGATQTKYKQKEMQKSGSIKKPICIITTRSFFYLFPVKVMVFSEGIKWFPFTFFRISVGLISTPPVYHMKTELSCTQGHN